ncbi:hypothetical protein BDZ97DRAFT_1235535 [Flammula alnicola]|nr:hypothetical protein BDZ97DRAFT_1235535 [Flammula alnicola]
MTPKKRYLEASAEERNGERQATPRWQLLYIPFQPRMGFDSGITPRKAIQSRFYQLYVASRLRPKIQFLGTYFHGPHAKVHFSLRNHFCSSSMSSPPPPNLPPPVPLLLRHPCRPGAWVCTWIDEEREEFELVVVGVGVGVPTQTRGRWCIRRAIWRNRWMCRWMDVGKGGAKAVVTASITQSPDKCY